MMKLAIPNPMLDRAMKMADAHFAKLSILAFIVFVVVVAAASHLFPKQNWDSIAYTGVVFEAQGNDLTGIHQKAYSSVRSQMTEGKFTVLTADRPYREIQFKDPAAFNSMLPFYRTKVLYIEAGALLSKWMDPMQAFRIISILSVLAIGLVCVLWLISANALTMGFAAIALLILLQFGTVGALVVPDLFAATFVMASILLICTDQPWAGILFLVLSVLARPDHVAFAGVLMVVCLACRFHAAAMITGFVLSFGAYWYTATAFGHPGWWVQMWFTHVEYVPTLDGFDPDFSIVTYFKIVIQTLVRIVVRETWLPVFLGMAGGALYLAYRWNPFTKNENVALFALVLTVAAKFLVFPLHEVRFHFAYLVAIGMIVIVGVARMMGKSHPLGAVS